MEWFYETYNYMAVGLAGLTLLIDAYTIKKPEEYTDAVKVFMMVISALVIICFFVIGVW